MKILWLIPMVLFVQTTVNTVIAGAGNTATTEPSTTLQKKALFAGGCFWGMEKSFEQLNGVLSVTSGYAGGATTNPNYGNYAAGGHREVVEIVYDPRKITYKELLDVFWHQIDPTDPDGQFVDQGHAYTSAIFYFDEEQRRLAEQSKKLNWQKAASLPSRLSRP